MLRLRLAGLDLERLPQLVHLLLQLQDGFENVFERNRALRPLRVEERDDRIQRYLFGLLDVSRALPRVKLHGMLRRRFDLLVL